MNPAIVLRNVARTATRRPVVAAVPRQRLRAAAVQVAARRSISSTEVAGPPDAPAPKKKEVKYTADSYPNIQRNSQFSKLTLEDVTYFESICPVVSIDKGASQDELEAFNTDWMRKYRGQTRLVVKPKSTEDVSKIIKHCNERKLAVVPQGGNTGLVGGSVPVFDEIVINMSNMNKVRSFDEVSGILTCDAGVVLEAADSYLREKGYIFPLDLGAKGSCHVGGNVATNAGGLRLLRYGSLHGTVLGVEVVLPDGRILDDLSLLRKNNTGYDLKQLFIGSEGTIGIITAISIICPQKPTAQNVAFFAVESYEKAQEIFVKTKQQLSEILSAFEFMDSSSQAFVKLVTRKKLPLETQAPFYVLIETSGSNTEHDKEKLDTLLENLMENEDVSDGTVAESETQMRELWTWREGIAEALGHYGGVYKYDVSIPLSELYLLVEDVRTRMKEVGLLTTPENPEGIVVDIVGYGHMGDSNLHLNIPVRGFDKRVEKALEPFIYEWIQKRRGSISAEHGLGVAKSDFVGYSRGETELGVMKAIKGLFDPNGIMNPYKYIKA
ncbi:D-lactate dehydrogenase 2 [Tricharina praecox]|uniref:D-lactate dehydrogenase 2 n=1 Tax=Tricharina praecox TaxID=43433 RepID=UPI002220B22D|nr:D-lactate dehydrogenase 2 [Tricharina praecox]KAI5844165.1 D-lactate dehydrogenase 2 [Tricharina praecox]